MLPDAKKQRRLQRVESGDATLMMEASSRCCPATPIKDGSLLEILAAENLRGFQTLLGSEAPVAFGPVANRKELLQLTWASVCSGSEGAWYVMAAINKACSEMGLGVKFKHVFSCESKAEKREWISQVFCHDADETDADDYYDGWCIFEDLLALSEGEAGEAKCATHDGMCEVKSVDLLVLGTSCKDLSKQQPDRSQLGANGPVLAQPTSRGGSAQTFHGFVAYVKKYRYENVDSIDDQLSQNAQTNLDILMEVMQANSYEGQVVMTDAHEFGLPCRRKRVYIFFMNMKSPKLDFAARPLATVWECFRKCVTSCLRSAPSAADILMDSECDEALQHLQALQEKQQQSNSSKKKPGSGWIEQHMKFAEGLGIRWGFPAEAELASNPWFKLLTDREQDVLKLSRKAAPQCAFRNLSQSLNRAHHGTLSEAGKVLAPTMLPGQLLWVELLKPPRFLLGREALLFQGFPVERYWESKDPEFEPSESLMQDLAGNAMAFPVLLAVIQSVMASAWLKPQQQAASSESVETALSALNVLLEVEKST
ncbi:unnamed protein product [Symbiodinium sp. KB8]|nr:unnamed protein product [Symbiodinium sp. KB8]